MNKAVSLALILVISMLSSALAEGTIHNLWDISMNKSTFEYKQQMKEQKNIEFSYSTGKESGIREEYLDSEGYITLYGYPVSIRYTRREKTDEINPYKVYTAISFSKIKSTDGYGYLLDGQERTNVVLNGLIEEYGAPTSIRIRFVNLNQSSDPSIDYVSEVEEPSSEYYGESGFNFLNLARSWKYPKEDISIKIYVYFSNILFSTDIMYPGLNGFQTVENRVSFFDTVPTPFPIERKETPQTIEPTYEDSGL